jgi:hypothetical protein
MLYRTIGTRLSFFFEKENKKRKLLFFIIRDKFWSINIFIKCCHIYFAIMTTLENTYLEKIVFIYYFGLSGLYRE